jgi:hypothetical protein
VIRLFSPLAAPLFLLVLLFGCHTYEAEKTETTGALIGSADDRISYMGRIGKADSEAAELYWSGTSVKINFEGTAVSALLQDERGENYYNVVIDGDSVNILRPDASLRYYTVASDLPEGKHTLELFKRTEYDRGKTRFHGFRLDHDATLLPASPPKERKMEFYGNSISAGYAIDDYSGNDSPDSIHTNNYLSYAALTARHFDAAYSCICKSGIGIMVSWFPYTMPDLFNRLDPNDPNSTWDFTAYSPDVVVINLLQNDSWLVNKPDHEEFKRVFGKKAPNEEYIINAYRDFVKTIRGKHPQAHIITALGSMDITQKGSPWPGYVEKAVASLEDDKIYIHFMPYKNTPGHPKVEEQQQMANSLIRFIEQEIKW